MRHGLLALLVVGGLVTAGCFQVATTIKVNGDGTGTIDERQYLTAAGLAQLGQMGSLGGRARTFDPLSEESARDGAARLGPGVTYVSSTPIADTAGQGRAITYAFADINQVHVELTPAGMPSVMPSSGQDAPGGVTCTMTKQENGNALLHIRLPYPALTQGGSGLPPLEQLAPIRSMIAGAHIALVVEPAGTVVRASTPFVDGNRVTLLEIDVDQALADEVLDRVRAAKTPDEIKAVLATVPGLKLNLDPELTIEFTPAK